MKSVLILRSADRAKSLCQLLTAFECDCLSMFDIQKTQARLSPNRQWDAVIFTSVNAVNCCDEALLDACKTKPCYAIGKATQAALTEKAIQAHCPVEASSEALLRLLESEHMRDKLFLCVTGEHGRNVLADNLHLIKLAVYRRVPLNLKKQSKYWDAIIVPSVEAFNVFLPQAKNTLYITFGERITKAIQLAGFPNVLTASADTHHLAQVVHDGLSNS